MVLFTTIVNPSATPRTQTQIRAGRLSVHGFAICTRASQNSATSICAYCPITCSCAQIRVSNTCGCAQLPIKNCLVHTKFFTRNCTQTQYLQMPNTRPHANARSCNYQICAYKTPRKHTQYPYLLKHATTSKNCLQQKHTISRKHVCLHVFIEKHCILVCTF